MAVRQRVNCLFKEAQLTKRIFLALIQRSTMEECLFPDQFRKNRYSALLQMRVVTHLADEQTDPRAFAEE